MSEDKVTLQKEKMMSLFVLMCIQKLRETGEISEKTAKWLDKNSTARPFGSDYEEECIVFLRKVVDEYKNNNAEFLANPNFKNVANYTGFISVLDYEAYINNEKEPFCFDIMEFINTAHSTDKETVSKIKSNLGKLQTCVEQSAYIPKRGSTSSERIK